jgi:PAS domain S-box-containing protein
MNHDDPSSPLERSRILRYGLAFVAVAATFGLRVVLTTWVGPGLPTYITFYPAVMVAALLGGLGPGLLATALTGLVTAYWILPPEGFAIASPVERLGVVLFSGMGLFMSVVAELYRRNRLKAAAYDREMALRETRREKEFLADVLEHASAPFAVGYPDGRVILHNHAFEELTGYNTDELRTIDWATTLTPAEWHERERQKLEELHRSGQPVRYEKEYVRKDGTRVPIELLVHLVKETDGQPAFYYSFLADITERKQAEDALRKSEQQLAADLAAMTRLQKLSAVFVREGNLEPVLGEIVEAAIAIAGADFGNIQLLHAAAATLHIVAQRGFPPWWIDFWNKVSEGQGVCGTALERGERVIVEDVEQSPIFLGKPALDIQRRAGVRAVQSTPLVSRSGRPLGMFSTHCRKPGRPDERALRLLDLLARQAADIIERAESEKALRKANEGLEQRVAERTAELQEKSRYTRNLLEASLDPLVTISREGKITDVNRATELITGATRGQLIGSSFSDYFTDPAEANAGYQKVVAEGLIRDYPLTVRHTDGHTTDVLYNAVVYRNEAGQVQGVFAAAHDMTERKRMEAEHAELLRRLKDAEETERSRISRELHDRLGQDLTGLKLGLQFIRKQGPFTSPVQQSIGRLEQLTDGLMRDIHRLAWELHPAALDDLGLEAVLRQFTTQWSETNKVPVDFHSNGVDTKRLPIQIETTLYRVAQEALNNVTRHARAKRISVLLERRPVYVSLIIEDDGRGFDAAKQVPTARGKLGLLGMKERVTLAGGTFEVESAPNAGTTVFVRVPLKSKAAES